MGRRGVGEGFVPVTDLVMTEVEVGQARKHLNPVKTGQFVVVHRHDRHIRERHVRQCDLCKPQTIMLTKYLF